MLYTLLFISSDLSQKPLYSTTITIYRISQEKTIKFMDFSHFFPFISSQQAPIAVFAVFHCIYRIYPALQPVQTLFLLAAGAVILRRKW